MACGKPVIYSNLDSLNEIEDVNKFAFLVEPDDLDKALGKISFYLKNSELLNEDSRIARKLFEEKYNWESIEVKLIEIVSSLLTRQ
jgi:glycosyltransferase involved in cell wall biosynthesis